LDIATTATFVMKKCVKRGDKIWRIIAKSLGEKSGKNNQEADKIALIRLLMFLSIFITNGFIIFNAIRSHIIPAEPKPVECIIINKKNPKFYEIF
jgi:hypothetical protein